MKKVVALILAGGEGARLSVLSEKRAKPSVPFAGKYRIIDFTLSNCVNSGIFNVAVLTQYRPHSLNDHIGIGKPWDLDRNRGGVRLLQPYKGRRAEDWYKGTADAVYQNLGYLDDTEADLVVILSGDHIYRMDYGAMLRYHQEVGASLTVAVMNVPMEETDRFGIMSVNENQQVTEFTEKPKQRDKGTLASMGIYIFDRDALEKRLRQGAAKESSLDFGKHVIPGMIADDAVYAYPFEGYWVDVGTIQSYWETNLALLEDKPALDLYDTTWVIHTRSEERPPAKIGLQARVVKSQVSNGCNVRGQVEHSVLSPGVYVSPGAIVRDSIIMNDTYIGPGAVVDKAIIDKNVWVGAGAVVGEGDDITPNVKEPDKLNIGVTVVGKGARIPANTRIGRNVLINSDLDESSFPGLTIASGETVG